MEQIEKVKVLTLPLRKIDTPTSICVYMIYNVENESEFYIGSTKNLYNRIGRHLSYLKHNDHPNENFQRLYDTCGISGLRLMILEEFDEFDFDTLRDSEQYYMDKFKPDINILKAVS